MSSLLAKGGAANQTSTIFRFAVAAVILILVSFPITLRAQQYCLSGAVTSVQSCSSCGINVGDPIAATFAVETSSITCNVSAIVSQCLTQASVAIDLGAQHWNTSGLQNPYIDGNIDVYYMSYPPQIAGSTFTLGSVSVPNVNPNGNPFAGGIQLSLLGVNLLPNGSLPTSVPTPAAVAASAGSSANFQAMIGDALAKFSYTGQNCAVGGAAAPAITTGGIVPVYSSSGTIQAGSWVSIFGTNLASSTATWNNNFPTSLAGTSVTINNKPAYLWYVSSTQINLQAPSDTATGQVPVVVTTAGGAVSSTVTLGQFGPSFSLLDGKHVAGIILRSDNSGAYGQGTYDIIGPTGNSLGYPTVAAKAGDSVVLFGVGFGPTNPVVPAGQAYWVWLSCWTFRREYAKTDCQSVT